MNTAIRPLLALACLCVSFCALAADNADNTDTSDAIRVIEVQHRPAQAVGPELKPFLSPDGVLKVANQKLLIRTDDDNFQQLQALAEKLDQPPQTLRIEVLFQRPPSDDARQYSTRSTDGMSVTTQEGEMARIARQTLGPERTLRPWQWIGTETQQQRQYRELVIAAELLDGRAMVNIVAISDDANRGAEQSQQAIGQVSVPLGEWVQIAGRTHLGQETAIRRYQVPGNDADAGVYIRLFNAEN